MAHPMAIFAPVDMRRNYSRWAEVAIGAPKTIR